jgi:hypothetical protein
MDQKTADTFYYRVKLPLDAINIGKYFIFSVGASLILLCTFAAIRLYRNNRANESINETATSQDNERSSLLNKSRYRTSAYNSTDEILNVPNEIID